jgi:Spy/CpxP family protein refolding chaperone
MKLLSIIAIGFAAAGLIVAAPAQGPARGGPGGMQPGGHRPHPGEMERTILSKLSLTHAQKVKTDALTDAYSKKVEGMFGNRGPGAPGGPGRGGPGGPGGGDRDAMRTKMKAMRDDYHAHLSKILSKAQMDKFDKMRDEMRAQMRARFGGGRGGGGGRGPGGGGGGRSN